ncbi:hypothetical protein ADK55_05060 [Streptomyces sp. WM4235]|nr:hypothetical protein ADK55_05060 [Streptomyces sp. WM4235]
MDRQQLARVIPISTPQSLASCESGLIGIAHDQDLSLLRCLRRLMQRSTVLRCMDGTEGHSAASATSSRVMADLVGCCGLTVHTTRK